MGPADVKPASSDLCQNMTSSTKKRQQSTVDGGGPGPGPGSGPGPGPGPGSGPGSVAMRSHASMEPPIVFKMSVEGSELLLGSDSPETKWSLEEEEEEEEEHVTGIRRATFSDGPTLKEHPTDLDSTLRLLKENVFAFVESEMETIQRRLSCSGSLKEEEEEEEEEEELQGSREAFLKIAVSFLRRMKQEGLADLLQSGNPAAVCQRRLKTTLKTKFQRVFEGVAKGGNPTLLNRIYTELYMTEGGSAGVNREHEVQQMESASRRAGGPETTIRHQDIFKAPPGRPGPVRTVLTQGVAGIGKTVLTQKFVLDWAEDQANQDIHFLFPFTFRELNLLRGERFSLVGLVQSFFGETKDAGIFGSDRFRVAFIFDGLDECRLPLDFHGNRTLTDLTESTTVDVLLTNLFRGNLLPSARLWITTRPAAANQIQAECVDLTTEVRGYLDAQKEEYFRKRFEKEEEASRIISHVRRSRSLHIMCHIPIFCWITATVLEDVLRTQEGVQLPRTLTEMYIHFLVLQSKLRIVKYQRGDGADPHWSPENREVIQRLGKLAFEQLQKGNLIFYQSDLTQCDIDVTAASVYSGVFTQIFREERGLYLDRVFCFVHLSVQEFLAALHVHLTFTNAGVDLLSEEPSAPSEGGDAAAGAAFYRSAVQLATGSPSGHLDLFLRFLLGLSLQTNQSLLRGLLTETETGAEATQDTIEFIKEKIGQSVSAERSINLFHCLHELNDSSLVEEIQQALRSGRLSTHQLSPAQWSALVFILLSSEEELEVFDLRKFSASEEALLWLLPVVKASSRVLLSGCNLSERSCEALAEVLGSSRIKELDLSNNNLHDSGPKLLAAGLRSPQCVLDTLRLSGCLITDEGFGSLARALEANPAHLRVLDLSFNHPGDLGQELLSSGLKDPQWRLSTLRMDPAGPRWLTPGLRKYSCQLSFDSNSVNRKVRLSEGIRATYVGEEQPYSPHPERFDEWPQLLCEAALTGRAYWEVEWSGHVDISLSYHGINRAGHQYDCRFGRNDQSWSLECSQDGYCVWHNNAGTVAAAASAQAANRAAVFLDWPAGVLSFYRVSPEGLTHLHTFTTTFTQPLYPGFGFWASWSGSVCLCSV